MKKYILKYTYILLLSFLGVSCKQSLETAPQASVQAGLLFTDIATAQAALNSAYAGLRSENYYGRVMIVIPELLADNCTLVNPAARSGRGLNEAQNLTGSHINIWTAYTIINTVNLILQKIDAIPNVDVNTPTQKALIKAQCYSLRALVHFDMVRVYAYNPNYIKNNFDLGVPIVLKGTDDIEKIELPERAKVIDVYKQIELDLVTAIDLFNASGTPNTNVAAGSANIKFVATRALAQALLSRVYLYWAGPVYADKYAKSIEYGLAALGSGYTTLSTAAQLPADWVGNQNTHRESFFEVRFAVNAENIGVDNSIQAWYQRKAASGQGWGDVIASNDLVSIYSGVDVRGQTGILGAAGFRTGESGSPRETKKYESGTINTGLDNVPVIRLAEIYCNLAESYFKSGDEGNARTYINALKVNRGLSATVATGTPLYDEILLEKRRELAFEGHRWFEFTRLGLAPKKPNGSVIGIDDPRILGQIPLLEIQAAKGKLIQNPGY
jgi:starch-binding outer membrane protein, SusD/RagB family